MDDVGNGREGDGNGGRTGGKGKGCFTRFEGIGEHRDFMWTKSDPDTVMFHSKEYITTVSYTCHGIWTTRKVADKVRDNKQWGYSAKDGEFEPYPVKYKQVDKEKLKRVRASLDYAARSHTKEEMRDGYCLVTASN